MAILVDEARWPWRGTTWCHLVSDLDLDELHEFAARLGCRRIGFQGDHYDIDIETRELALELGAEACNSRELVRRLRSAGLRLRPSSFPKWELVERWSRPTDPSPLRGAIGLERLARAFDEHIHPLFDEPSIVLEGAFGLRRHHARALVVYGLEFGPPVVEDASNGRYHRVDGAGRWAVEIVDPPLRSAE